MHPDTLIPFSVFKQLKSAIDESIIEYDIAIEIYFNLVHKQGKTELSNDLALVYGNKGSSFDYQENFNEAVVEYDKAIEIWEKLLKQDKRTELTDNLAMSYWGKGNAVNSLENINEAIEFYGKSINLFEEILKRGEVHNLPNMAIVLGIRFDTYKKAGNADLAEKDMLRLHELLEFTKQHKEIEHLGKYIQTEIDKRS